ncbi:hypothetical protein Cni_G02817 [Canna indica]|uniref:RING-type E3 ubiquitin transferase BRCA1 n=1 Tax=Canna indica TaxID=4628 RepID=A0AAQ3JTE4_9LILI|nr:hypothetical protein Cni_G02817 [Canna indica]
MTERKLPSKEQTLEHNLNCHLDLKAARCKKEIVDDLHTLSSPTSPHQERNPSLSSASELFPFLFAGQTLIRAEVEAKQADMASEDDPSDQCQDHGFRPIQGMESVIATVSGYHGTERFKLIKLIARTGANYIGAMTKSTTHLVCWQFEGKKYNIARNTGCHVISHRWFEDCLKEKKWLPEHSYTRQSGKEVGPITWEVPAIMTTSAKGKSIISAKRGVLCDNFNALNCSKAVDVDARYLNWPESDLLDKHNEFSPLKKFCSSRKKRNLFDANQDDVACAQPSRRHRLKKKTYCYLLEYTEQDQKQGTSVKKCSEQPGFIDPDADCQNNLKNMVERDDIIELCRDENKNDSDATSDLRVSSDNDHCQSITEHVGSSKNGIKDNEFHKKGHILYESDATKQAEVSCVICWTEFCTVRAVLPCGHRFCYSCIQGWADCMVSSGKASTCPLCKASFKSITKMDDASTDQKIYSQTIPLGSSNTDALMLSNEQPLNSLCYECGSHEPEELLVCCHMCQSRWIHSYCLDPPLFPWTCVHCRDLRALYRHFR